MTADRLTAASGIAFAVTFAAGVIILGEMFGMSGDADTTYDDYYADDHPADIAGAVLLAVSGLLFPAFVSGLVQDMSARLQALSLVFASVFAALVMVAASAAGAIPGARAFGAVFGDDDQATTAVWLPATMSYILLCVAGALTASCTIVLMAVAPGSVLASGAPRYLSLLVAAILLLGPMVMPLVVLPLWAGGLSIWLLARRPDTVNSLR